jgi:hypothetical protein
MRSVTFISWQLTPVTRTHLLRKNRPLRRQTHLAVIELPDEISAFQAYRLLHYHGISPEHLAIVGEGYSSPERIGLLRPGQIAMRQAGSLSVFAGSLGALIGLVLLISTQAGVVSWPALDQSRLWMMIPALSIVCGFCGAVIGGLMGLFGEGTAAELYRHRLRQGRYLLMIEGSEKLVRWGQEVLSQYSTSRLY